MPGPPGVIRVEEIGNTWVKLLWTKGADHNSPILYYTIQTRHYWSLNEDDWRNASTCKYRCIPAEGDICLIQMNQTALLTKVMDLKSIQMNKLSCFSSILS